MSVVKLDTCPACDGPVPQPFGVHRLTDTVHVHFHRGNGDGACRLAVLVTSTGGTSATEIPDGVSAESVLAGSTLTGFAGHARSS